ncbi:MAG: sulfatase-like hydrolase/transferase [bacterium]
MYREKKRVILGVTLAVTMALSSACVQDGGKKQPEVLPTETHATQNADGNYNVLFITVDQQHYFDEYPKGASYEARELLAQLGTTFEKHYACSNMSTSSRSVIYTGTHITDTKMCDNTDYPWQPPISEELTTIGDMMGQAGYYAAYKGKFHMGSAGVLDHSTEPQLQGQNGLLGYGFADWNAQGDIVGNVQQGFFEDMPIASETVKWLRSTGTQKNTTGQSFFLAVNLVNPHDVMYYDTDDKGEDIQNNGKTTLEIKGAPDHLLYQTTYPDAPIPPSWNEAINSPGRVAAHGVYLKLWDRRVGSIPSEEIRWERFRDYYFNCIQDSDNQLMSILKELVSLDMMDNTIIAFTSDHGEMQGAHGLRGKGGFMYDNNIHVPLIIVHPEYKGGKSIDAVTSHLDLAPTFVDMTSISAEKKAAITGKLAGGSLLKLMDGSASKIRTGALFCFEMLSMLDDAMTMTADAKGKITAVHINLAKRGFVRGITTEGYKFARYFSPQHFNTPTTLEELYANNDVELYDLAKDPGELKNLAADKETNAGLIMELNALLNELIAKEIGPDNGSEVADIIQTLSP